VVRFRWQRESVKFRLGCYGAGPGELDLKEAREKAEGVQRLVQRGVDPRVEEQAAKADDRLVENVLDRYLAEHVDKRNRRNSAKQNRQIIEARIRPVWRGRLISDLDRHAINALIKPIIVSRPALTHRVRSIISRWCRWMVEEDILDDSPFRAIRVPPPIVARERVLSTAEVRTFLLACRRLPMPVAGCFELLLLTGQRREEAAAMTWDEVDLDASEPRWTMPRERSKNGKPHLVPLVGRALAILHE
jgi:integrase